MIFFQNKTPFDNNETKINEHLSYCKREKYILCHIL